MPADCYLIISGVKLNEGCVIVRSKNKVEDFVELNNEKNINFLIHTNYDRDEEEPEDDNRRE